MAGSVPAGTPLGLLCHKCQSAMPWPAREHLTCPKCGTSYPVVEGIPVIRNDDRYYHGLLPRERMLELLSAAREMGWEAALARTIREEPDHRKIALRDILLDESRAAFKVLLKPLAGRRVLDLGCGSGSTAICLARWAEEVVGCDLTWERVAFLAMRAKALRLHNLRTLCAGDTRPLPFPAESFDCVVLNGVLEWSAGEGERAVREMQREFLQEIGRVLRPDGQLYIGIENRLGFGYFLGQPEDHTGVRFAALAPRWLADIMVRRASGRDYRTHTYSRGGYRALLRDAGFHGTCFYAPVPDYRKFNEIAPLDSPGTDLGLPRAGWRERVKHRLHRNRWLAPSFGIVASRRRPDKAWIAELTEHVCRRLELPVEENFPQLQATPWSTATAIAHVGRAAVIRIPLDPESAHRVRRNFEGLQQSQAVARAFPFFESPRPLISDTFREVTYTVESRLAGLRYGELTPHERAQADRRLFDFILRFKTAPPPCSVAINATEVWRRDVLGPLARIEACASCKDARQRLSELRDRADAMDVESLPGGFSHGDLWWGNVLLHGEHRIGLIDWDAWSPAHFATTDFVHFTCYRRVFRDGSPWPRAFVDWLHGTNVDLLEREWTDRFATALGMAGHWRIAAGLAYWVGALAAHDDSKLRLDQVWTKNVVDAVLPSMNAALAAVNT